MHRVDTSLIVESRLRSRSQSPSPVIPAMSDQDFILRMQTAFKDPQFLKIFREAMKPSLKATETELHSTIVTSLTQQLKVKQDENAALRDRVVSLEDKLDEMEQWTRRGSMRIQGLKDSPSESNELLDQKIIDVCQAINVEPPITVDDIEVAHRLPLPRALLQKIATKDAEERGVPYGTLPDGSQSTDLMKLIPPAKLPPRNVIVKFASRRVKSRVLAPATKKKLKTKLTNKSVYPHDVYFQDDLTAKKAKLAYLGRKLKLEGKVTDSWVFDSKVLIKDLHNRIRQIRCLKDLAVYGVKPDEASAPAGAAADSNGAG